MERYTLRMGVGVALILMCMCCSSVSRGAGGEPASAAARTVQLGDGLGGHVVSL